MHLTLFASGPQAPAPSLLLDALRHAGRSWPEIATPLSWTDTSASGHVTAAGIGHARASLGPREPISCDEHGFLALEGFPYSPAGRPWDAGWLRENWSRLPDLLEGAFAAIRVDRRADVIEVLSDPVGHLPVYVAERASVTYLSTSLLALRVLTGAHSIDPLSAVHSMVVGSRCGDRTSFAGIRVLDGGAVTRLTGDGRRTVRRHFGPETLAPLLRSKKPLWSPEDAGEALVGMLGSVRESRVPVQVGLTGGRDSRTCTALFRAAGVSASYGTVGRVGEPDVDVALQLAQLLGLRHTVQDPQSDLRLGGAELMRAFVERTDGMSALDLAHYHAGLASPPETLGLYVNGAGGEIGRAGSGLLTPLAANASPLSHLWAVQRGVARSKVVAHTGLLRPEAADRARRAVEADLEGFREAGWPNRAAMEGLYAFFVTARTGMEEVRGVAGHSELLAPLVTRPWLRWALSGSPGRRLLELPHRDLLGALDPRLQTAPFEKPWREGRPEFGPFLVAAQAAGAVVARLRKRDSATAEDPGPAYAELLWRRDSGAHLELLAAVQHSDVFEMVDRDRLISAFSGEQAPPGPALVAMTLLWATEGQPTALLDRPSAGEA